MYTQMEEKYDIPLRKFSVMTEKQRRQKLAQIFADLESSENKKVSQAIKSLEKYGDASVIRPLCEMLLKGLPEKQEGAIVELLSSIKDTSVVVEMMEVIEEKKFLPVRQKLLSAIWNMKVDFSGYIDEFVGIAVQGDFMEALDCLTIIENLEGPFLEEDILESQLHLKNFLESKEEKDAQKAYILSEIALKIKEINQSLMD